MLWQVLVDIASPADRFNVAPPGSLIKLRDRRGIARNGAFPPPVDVPTLPFAQTRQRCAPRGEKASLSVH